MLQLFSQVYFCVCKKQRFLELQTIDDFAKLLHLTSHDVRNPKMIFNRDTLGYVGFWDKGDPMK